MRNLIWFFLKFYLFWISFFIFFRILFIGSQCPFNFEISTAELLKSLIAGIQLDISTVSYLCVLPFVFCVLKIFGAPEISIKMAKWYSSTVVFILTMVCLSNIIIFKYWGTLLNNRALAYLAQPKEMLASVTNMQLILLVSLVAVLYWLMLKIYTRIVLHSFREINANRSIGIIVLIIIFPMIGIGMRGGLQLIPVNESSAVYSHHHVLNQIAINPAWFLGHNLKQSGLNDENQYQFMDSREAAEITNKTLQKSSSDTSTIFNLTSKPNVVFILLESWTADIIEPLDGVKGVTPNFTQLSNEGLLFTSIYSSGFRTDQALISVLSGFPSQPNKSIIRFPAKAASLPSVSREFKDAGYTNSFYYGGELGFANMNNYLNISGFEKIVSIENFSSNKQNSKWGAHDEYVLKKQLEDLDKEKQPFFSTLLTLSTHEPFEVPIETPFTGDAEPELFKKSAWYTDHCLGEYFKNAKQSPWYSNTIFILLADHGHRLPLNREYIDPQMRRIPVLIVSELLKDEFKSKTDSTIANQHDIAATILKNLGMDDSKFNWSVNIFDKARTNFAYLSLDIAFTWKEEKNILIIPLQPGMEKIGDESPRVLQAKAYLQHLYQTFTDF